MGIGTFSLSLSVKDINVSKEFYMKLGFEVFGGVQEQKWLIMKSEDVVIGLFEGMFEGNMMTFNPGWDADAQNIDPFTDVRNLEQDLKKKNIEFVSETQSKEGPGSFMIKDPDGNVILVDQLR